MSVPANWQPRETTVRSGAAARAALFLGLFGTTAGVALIFWRVNASWPTGVSFRETGDVQSFFIKNTPYLFCMGLLCFPNPYGRAFAAGVACLTAAARVCMEVILLSGLYVILIQGGIYSPALRSLPIVVFLSLLCNLLVLLVAPLQSGFRSRAFGAFVLGLALAAAFVPIGCLREPHAFWM